MKSLIILTPARQRVSQVQLCPWAWQGLLWTDPEADPEVPRVVLCKLFFPKIKHNKKKNYSVDLNKKNYQFEKDQDPENTNLKRCCPW